MKTNSPIAPPIDEKQIENLTKIGADDADIAALIGIPLRALRRRFGTKIARARAERRTLIRKLIWTAVTEGDVALLTWLGKAELGWNQPPMHGDHLEPRPRRRFDFDAFAAEFAKLHGAGAVTDGESS